MSKWIFLGFFILSMGRTVSAATDGIFDPENCMGSQISKAEYLNFFPAGQSNVRISTSVEVGIRKRTINKLTGAGPWIDMTSTWVQPQLISGTNYMDMYTNTSKYGETSTLEASIHGQIFYATILTNDLVKLDPASTIVFNQGRNVLSGIVTSKFPKYVIEQYATNNKYIASLVTNRCAYFLDGFEWPIDNVTYDEVQIAVSAKFEPSK